VLVLSADCKETGGNSAGVKARQSAMTKRLAVCNPTVTQTKLLKARSPIIKALLCILQTARETLNKYCKVRKVWSDTNNSKINMHDEIQD
jgi:hypothetical protein